jgi:hypothetical protein
MSIEITAKGYHVLRVGGVQFSQHVVEREGFERASQILEADPSLVCTITPPTIEVRASAGAVAVESPAPVTSDGGEDLIDFIERTSAEPNIVAEIASASSVEEAADEFAEETKKYLYPLRFYARLADGRREWVGMGWRGYVLLWNRRLKGAIKIGG